MGQLVRRPARYTSIRSRPACVGDYTIIWTVPSRRPNCVRRLHIDPMMLYPAMPAAVTTMIVGSQCGSLQQLFIAARDVGLAGQNIAALAALMRLRCLEVCIRPLISEALFISWS